MGVQDDYNQAYTAGYNDAAKKYRAALLDVAVMFENIERNRQMPAFAQTLDQYVAMGRLIKRMLATDINAQEDSSG